MMMMHSCEQTQQNKHRITFSSCSLVASTFAAAGGGPCSRSPSIRRMERATMLRTEFLSSPIQLHAGIFSNMGLPKPPNARSVRGVPRVGEHGIARGIIHRANRNPHG